MIAPRAPSSSARSCAVSAAARVVHHRHHVADPRPAPSRDGHQAPGAHQIQRGRVGLGADADRVARPRRQLQRDRDRLLGAAGDDDVVGLDVPRRAREGAAATNARKPSDPSAHPYCSAGVPDRRSACRNARASSRFGNCASDGSPPASPTTRASAAAARRRSSTACPPRQIKQRARRTRDRNAEAARAGAWLWQLRAAASSFQ